MSRTAVIGRQRSNLRKMRAFGIALSQRVEEKAKLCVL